MVGHARENPETVEKNCKNHTELVGIHRYSTSVFRTPFWQGLCTFSERPFITSGKPEVGEEQILDSLKRLVSGVLTHPVTIGKMIGQHTPKRKKNSPKSVHLVGTDRPEATMIYAGFYHEILASNPLNPIKLTLVSPDEANRQLATDCSPASPMLINPRCKLTAWEGLYHDFWDK